MIKLYLVKKGYLEYYNKNNEQSEPENILYLKIQLIIKNKEQELPAPKKKFTKSGDTFYSKPKYDINILYTKFSRNITDKINYVKNFYLISQTEKFLL